MVRHYVKPSKHQKEKSFKRLVKELILVCAITIIISIMLLVSILL